MGLSRELGTQIPRFATGAKNRIDNLIRIIQDLRWQLQEAQQQAMIANLQLHDLLLGGGLAESLESWGAGEEYNAKVFGNRQGSKLFELLKHRTNGGWRWNWDEPAKLLELVGVPTTDHVTKQTEVEGAVKGLGVGNKLDIGVAGAEKAADNKGLLATAVVLAYLEEKEKDSKEEWEVTSVLAKDWMGKKLKDSQVGVDAKDYVDVIKYVVKVKEKLFPPSPSQQPSSQQPPATTPPS